MGYDTANDEDGKLLTLKNKLQHIYIMRTAATLSVFCKEENRKRKVNK